MSVTGPQEKTITSFPWPTQPGGQRLSAPEWAFQEVWGRIVRGEIAVGERVTEESLAETLEISRTPLREAILRLQEIGFLERRRNRALCVTPMSAEEAEELTLIRERLEGLAARLAARNRDSHPELVAQTVRHVEQMKALQGAGAGPDPVLRLGDEFHSAVVRLSGSQRLPAMLSQVYLAIERYRYLLNENHDRAAELATEHERIIRAIAAGDEDAAEAAIRAHIAHSRQLYIDELDRLLAARAS